MPCNECVLYLQLYSILLSVFRWDRISIPAQIIKTKTIQLQMDRNARCRASFACKQSHGLCGPAAPVNAQRVASITIIWRAARSVVCGNRRFDWRFHQQKFGIDARSCSVLLISSVSGCFFPLFCSQFRSPFTIREFSVSFGGAATLFLGINLFQVAKMLYKILEKCVNLWTKWMNVKWETSDFLFSLSILTFYFD